MKGKWKIRKLWANNCFQKQDFGDKELSNGLEYLIAYFASLIKITIDMCGHCNEIYEHHLIYPQNKLMKYKISWTP